MIIRKVGLVIHKPIISYAECWETSPKDLLPGARLISISI